MANAYPILNMYQGMLSARCLSPLDWERIIKRDADQQTMWSEVVQGYFLIPPYMRDAYPAHGLKALRMAWNLRPWPDLPHPDDIRDAGKVGA